MYRLLTKREKIILGLTVGLVVFSLGFNILIAPLLERNDTLNNEINLSKIKLKKYMRLLSQRDYLLGEYNKFSSTVNLSQANKDTLVSALSELEELSKDANIRLIDIRPQGPKESELIREIFIDLKTEGTMEGYLKFVYHIENSLSLLEIKKFQLNAKPDTQNLEGTFSILRLSIND